MSSPIVSSIVALAYGLLLLPAPSHAQPPVLLSGVVVDDSGGVIGDAQVRVKTTAGAIQASMRTNAGGAFGFPGLAPGGYVVEVEKPLFEAARVEVDLGTAAPQPLHITLRVSGIREEVSVSPPVVDDRPAGQTFTIQREQFKNARAATIGDLIQMSPGVTVVQGNGPRDSFISIRGSNARAPFGVRNIKLYEDGFPTTSPDGTGRTETMDPHMYSGMDVMRGPSSSLYGNYATGGAINFRTVPGGEINGFEVSADAGSFGYRNAYGTFGHKGAAYEVMAFGSRVSGDGYIAHTGFSTVAESLYATFAPSATDKFAFKFLNNDLATDLSIRLSLNQFKVNPFQKGCTTASADATAAGCATLSLFPNGFNGTRVNVSPEQANTGRRQRRTILGGRWEHAIRPGTAWRTQLVFDIRDLKEPTGATAAVGSTPAFNFMSDVTRKTTLLGREATHFAGMFANYQNIHSYTYNVTAAGTDGALASYVLGSHLNIGARAREEITFNPQWTGVVGIGLERTTLDAGSTTFTYPTNASPTTAVIPGLRNFMNVAPEAVVFYQPSSGWKLHGRVGTGYGTPQATNLFVTPDGVSGNNTQLKSQSNVGVDAGADWRIGGALTASLTWFYEQFKNELVTQSPGSNLLNYTFNAPRSVHKGVEVAADWHPLATSLPGAHVSMAYSQDDQRYTNYVERLSAGTQSVAFDRSGNRIPGLTPHAINVRATLDLYTGTLRGLGGFVEVNGRHSAFADNANLLEIPGYQTVDLNLHYNSRPPGSRSSGAQMFFEVRNLTDRIYVASAANIADGISVTTGLPNPASTLANSGSIWAGAPRSLFGGVRFRF